MPHAIETAPKDGHLVILDDDANADCHVGRRSPEAADRAENSDGPIKIGPTPSNVRDAYLQLRDEGSVVADTAAKRAWRRIPIPVVSVVAAATLLFYGVREAAAQPAVSDGIVARDSGLHDLNSKSALPEVRWTVESQAAPPAEEEHTAREQRAAATPMPDAQPAAGPKPPEAQAQQAALEDELGEARRTIARLEAQLQAGPTAEQIKQERERAVVFAEHAAAARQELQASAAQHRQALEEERARSAALASELALARREIETQAAQSRQANAETALSRQAATANTEQLLEEQRQKMAAALADAAAARQELAAHTEQYRQAIEEERARNGKIASELAATQQVNQKLAVQFRLIGEQTELRRRAYEAEVAALQQALRQERDEAAAGVELDAARRAAGVRTQLQAATRSPLSREIASTPGLAIAPPAASDAQGGTEAARMTARASLLLGQGDIGAARIVLERAAELGSARAVFMLAQTYDPEVLAAWKTFGTRGEVERARELYAKAQAGGVREAQERLEALGR